MVVTGGRDEHLFAEQLHAGLAGGQCRRLCLWSRAAAIMKNIVRLRIQQ